MSKSSPLAVYLRNHEAAGRAGLDLFRRVARSHRRRPHGPELAQLRDDVAADLDRLRQLMADLGVPRDALLGTALRLGERVGRLKPNGAVLTRAPLTDLIEIEALTDAVHAKLAGWRALAAARVRSPRHPEAISASIRSAEDQTTRLWALHRQLADVLAAE